MVDCNNCKWRAENEQTVPEEFNYLKGYHKLCLMGECINCKSLEPYCEHFKENN